MNIEIQGHMNTPKWVFSTLPSGPYEKFHPKDHLPLIFWTLSQISWIMIWQ